ncbi:LOW QUALITY PROTEIN: hypothetical protein PRUPE_2G119000 [Prunus persica]|uniref:RRM domain-containing protein n=1 Tax=Prunus persica TaxID=3760 RepID=A0A251QES3_PRUPE|nr:LOW QUALITY PROTEIN: hypothetical protein PRUPE_2G119000 [Prunus persica]
MYMLVNCSNCRTPLQLPPGAESIRCALCQAVTLIADPRTLPPPASSHAPTPPSSYSHAPSHHSPYSQAPPPPSPYSHAPPGPPPNAHGRKKAVICGISYKYSRHELKGCINDAKCMRFLLINKFHFPEDSIVMLTEDNNGEQPMPDLPDQDPSSSDSDSDSGLEDGDQAQKNLQLQTLEAELSINRGNYNGHVQYIKILRQMADIVKLRQAMEAMNELFPLTPSMWIGSTGSHAFPAIEKLYEQGVFEYLSISLWHDYLYFVQQNDPSVRECSSAGILKARNLFERALTAAGLHVSEGNKLWEGYREFEQAIFCYETDNQAREKQIQLIRNLFHHQLSVPHVDMRSTLLDYKAWEVERGNILDAGSSDLDGISSHVASVYQKALELYNASFHLEKQICRQGIYLWLEYTHYLDETLKVGSIITNVYSRAVKNCPCVGELCVRYLLLLERGHASEKEISTVFEKSLQCILTLNEYLNLYLTRVDGLRRRLSCPVEGENVLDYSLIRETFQNASDYFSANLKITDGLLRLHAYWACLELNLPKDLLAAREVWESLLKIRDSMLEAWQGYIAMETELGHFSLYVGDAKRFPATGSEDICHLWLCFEREFGSLDDFDHAVQKVSPRLEGQQLFKSQQETKFTGEGDDYFKKNACDKRKQVSEIPDEQYPAKWQKNAAQKIKKAHGKDSEILNSFEQNTEEKIKAKGDKPDVENEQPMKEPVSEKTKVHADQCTAFVLNFPSKANEEHLHQIFGDVGGVVAIRILHDKFTGKPREMAFVDFSDDAHLVAAVAKNKQRLLGKKLSIGKKEHARGSESRESAETSNGSRAHRALQSTHTRGSDNVQLRGRNTFATPRNILSLGQTANKPKTEEQGDEKPKSNDELRNMFLKG